MRNSQAEFQRRKIMRNASETRDRISSLPEILQEEILQRLPLRDAVRTGILSREWRHKWRKIPHVIFDEQCLKQPSRKILTDRFSRVVDQVLTQHTAPIQKFKLSLFYTKATNSAAYVKKWVHLLSQKGIRDLSIELVSGGHMNLESSLCFCEQLEALKLRWCTFSPPESFEGFKYLKDLHLEALAIHQKDFVKLASSPLLEKLTLVDMILHPFEVKIPSLKHLHIQGIFDHFDIENAEGVAFFLLHVSQSVVSKKIRSPKQEQDTCKISQVFGCVPNIEKLEVWSHSMEFLTIGGVPLMLPTMLNQLKDVFLAINFDDWNQISAALCLIRSSPNLERLRIGEWLKKKRGVRSAYDFWVEQCRSDSCFERLRIVVLEKFSRSANETGFLYYILRHSRKVERVEIKVRGWIQHEDLMWHQQFSMFCSMRGIGNIRLVQDMQEVDYEKGLSTLSKPTSRSR